MNTRFSKFRDNKLHFRLEWDTEKRKFSLLGNQIRGLAVFFPQFHWAKLDRNPFLSVFRRFERILAQRTFQNEILDFYNVPWKDPFLDPAQF